MVYVHGEFIDNKIEEYGHVAKSGKNKGKAKKPSLAKKYRDFKKNKYLPMVNKISAMKFDVNNPDSFQDCADVLNEYYSEVRKFMKWIGLSDNSKLHTNFLEEFSVYFLHSILSTTDFDIFNKAVFAGLKIDTKTTLAQIKKDVDFCVGKDIAINVGGTLHKGIEINGKKEDVIVGGTNEIFRIPAISVEVKTYVDATMLGEIMNTSRKIKGANPGSKAILLTCAIDFADEHVLEAAFDSSIDEIVVLGRKKRKDGDVIEFTKEGLCDYYLVMQNAVVEVTHTDITNRLGRMLAYVKHLA